MEGHFGQRRSQNMSKSNSNFKGHTPTWCPGCGDWAIRLAIQNAMKALSLEPWNTRVVFGIGCSGNMNDFLNAYAIHSLHGRAIPNAIGLKLAHHNSPVIAIAGDGDSYGEGGNHFLHAARGNHDITVIIHDNSIYGLTTGQAAPTSLQGMKAKSTPEGLIEVPINPLSLALTQGATFIAQAFAGDLKQTSELIKKGIEHKGFSLVNILQPCVTFNKINTYHYYLSKTYKLDEKYNSGDYKQALEKAEELREEKYPLGVMYEIQKPAYHEQIDHLTDKNLSDKERFTDFKPILDEFM